MASSAPFAWRRPAGCWGLPENNPTRGPTACGMMWDVLTERLDALEQVMPDPQREQDLRDLAARVQEWT